MSRSGIDSYDIAQWQQWADERLNITSSPPSAIPRLMPSILLLHMQSAQVGENTLMR